MSFLFGGAPKTSRDPVKDYQRDPRHAVRSMEREDLKAGAQEKALLASIAKHAKENKFDLCKVKAKELVRLRGHRTRLVTMKGHMTTLQHQLSTVQSARVMQDTMSKTTKLLQSLNRKLDAKSVHKMLLEFERQSTSFQDGQEILETTLDDLFEQDNERSDTDAAVASVFQELGLDTMLQMQAPNSLSSALEALTLEERLEKIKS